MFSKATLLSNQFKRLSEEVCIFVEDEGLSVRPYGHEILPYFNQLTEEAMEAAVVQLTDYLNICNSVYKEGRRLKDSEFFVHKALQYYNFECSPALSEYLKNPKYIAEFYSLGNLQFFRTLNYFEVTSYTIEDIYCRQWMHLYQRDEAVGAKIYDVVMKMVEGQGIDNYYFPDQNILKERVSLERLEILIKGLHVSALKQQGELRALASLIHAETLYAKTDLESSD